jgi:hypothetical protein
MQGACQVLVTLSSETVLYPLAWREVLMMIFVPHCICAITITSIFLSSPKGLLLPLLYCTVQSEELSSVHVLHNTPYVTVERILFRYLVTLQKIETLFREYRFIDPPKTPHTNPNMVNKATLSKKVCIRLFWLCITLDRF